MIITELKGLVTILVQVKHDINHEKKKQTTHLHELEMKVVEHELLIKNQFLTGIVKSKVLKKKMFYRKTY